MGSSVELTDLKIWFFWLYFEGFTYICMHVCMPVGFSFVINMQVHNQRTLQVCLQVSLHVCLQVSLHVCLQISLHVCLQVSLHVCLQVSTNKSTPNTRQPIKGMYESRSCTHAANGMPKKPSPRATWCLLFQGHRCGHTRKHVHVCAHKGLLHVVACLLRHLYARGVWV
jgi:hypothetical protein